MMLPGCMRFLCVIVMICLSFACDRAQRSAPSDGNLAETGRKPLTVYCGRSQLLVKNLFRDFETATGVRVEARYEGGTQALANRLVAEGKQTEADVFFAQDSGYLGALAAKGLLAKLPEDVLGKVARSYADQEGHWVGTSGRARVLVYDPTIIKPGELPVSLSELASERWRGRFGWAPGNASFQAHVSGLRHLWGEDKTRQWLKAMHALKAHVYPKNSVLVRAVANGEIDVAWVNHYYLHKLKAIVPDLKAANYSFPTSGDAGNVLMLSGVAMTAHTNEREQALMLIRYLLSKLTQTRFAQDLFEYPTVAGIALHKDVEAIEDQLVRFDQMQLTDIQPTLLMLKELQVL